MKKRSSFLVFCAPCCESFTRWWDLRVFSSQPALQIELNPAHAGLLIVVGQVSRQAAPLLQDVYGRLLVGARVLHLTGCDCPKSAYASLGDLTQLMPVWKRISGCPFDASALGELFTGAHE